MRNSQKTLALWALILVGALILYQAYEQKQRTRVADFNFSKFLEAVEKDEVASVTFRSNSEIAGKFKPEFAQKYKGDNFLITGNTGDEIFRILKAKGIVPNYENAENNGLLSSLFISWLPLILIFLMFMFFMRQIQAGGGKAMNFGKSKAKMLNENKNKVTFKDVAGVEEAKEELAEVVDFLKEPKKYTRLGGRIPKGVLLVGPPGTGKTLLARAVAGEAGVPFFTISGSDFVEMFVGVGASRVRDLFEQGKRHAPCIIFIDEIDAVGRHRGAGMGGGHDEREQTLDQLLVEMDGFESNEGVILISATNRPDILDPALLRPGRFDRRVVVGRPDVKGREQILAVHTRKTPLAKDVNLDIIAKGTPGFTGAELESLVNEAALLAARENKNIISMDHFERAKDKVMMGSERKSLVISDNDKKITAYHEAGHTIVALKVENGDPVNKVTIVPRGMALGVTQIQPDEDRLNYSKGKALATIAYMFGGRVAEEVVFNEITSGASNDIERATELARRMVCEWGMSDKMGPIAYAKQEGPVFLGLQQSQAGSHFSEKVIEEIDTEIRLIISNAHKDATRILNEHRDKLDIMAEALLELETLDRADIDAIMTGSKVTELVEKRKHRAAGLKIEDEESAAKIQAAEKAKDDATKNTSGSGIGDGGPVIA